MDHLPLPHGVTKYPYDIPVLCTAQYDNGTFRDYPTRCGWNLNELQNGKFDNVPAGQELAPFLQTWLYFGLLADVLDVELDFNDFRGEDGFLSTPSLSTLIEDWKTRIYKLDVEAKQAERYRVYDRLMESAKVGKWLSQVLHEVQVPDTIILSMQVLVFTLHTATMWIWRGDIIGSAAMSNAWMGSRLILSAMYRDGWCPALLNRWSNRTNAPTLAYMRELGRPDADDHSRCGSDGDWNKCAAKQVDTKTYRTKHVTSECDCEYLGVDQRAISEIVHAGGVPVLKLVDNKVEVAYDEKGEYVAISHVWKDGLGNIGHNSLPSCQLKMIDAKVREIGGNGFWIDTICVPAQKELKAAALKRMDKVYRDARYVLVLEAYLRISSCKNNTLDNYLRISMCSWMERLWTFQEAVLAREGRLRIAFADGLIDSDYHPLQRIIDSHRLAVTWDTARNYTISHAVLAHISGVRGFNAIDFVSDNWTANVLLVWLSGEMREVSVPSDETLVFATLFGLDPGRLYLLDPDQRMKALLDMHDEWTQEFLFAHGPRLRVRGYQWAPASFLKCSPAYPSDFGRYLTGRRTARGFVVQRQSFKFVETEAEIMSESFMCKDEGSGKWYRFMFQKRFNPDDVPAWSTLSPRKGRKAGFLVGPDHDVDGTRWVLLVSIDNEEGDLIFATFGCRLTMVCLDGANEILQWAEMLAPWERPDEVKAQEMKLWPGKDCWEVFGRIEECSESQKWCIG